MFITKKHMSRRTVLRGMGAAVSLPFLESMVSAMPSPQEAGGSQPVRVACLEIVHGSAGSTRWGLTQNMWSPAKTGRDFDLGPSALSPLEPWKDYLTIVSNTDMRPAEAWGLKEIGGDHFRSSAVFLTQSHPKQTQSSDVYAGISFDQYYAKRFGQDTALPSLQIHIEHIDKRGGAATTATPARTRTRSAGRRRPNRCRWSTTHGWSSTSCSESAGPQKSAPSAGRWTASILDWLSHTVADLSTRLGPADRHRLDQHLENMARDRATDRQDRGTEPQR